MVSLEYNVPLAQFTTFHIGGPARCFARVKTTDELVEALRYAQESSLSVFLLGGGSNLLVSDKGYDGLVIKVEQADIAQDDMTLSVGAGVKLLDVVRFAAAAGLQGMELLAGIPGSVGGAIRGNAGAFGPDVSKVVQEVTAVNQKTLETRTFSCMECEFAYRQSFFKNHPEWVVFSAKLIFRTGDPRALLQVVEETIAKREAKHSQSAWCAGSFFMNPSVADEALRHEFEQDAGVVCKDDKLPAGWLIDHVGLRGKKVGGAMVSNQHPNYIVNIGNATAEDVIILSSVIKQKIRTELGIRLVEEVQMVGF